MHPEMHTDAYMHTNCLHHGLVARVLLRLPVCGNVCDVEQETAFVVLPDFRGEHAFRVVNLPGLTVGASVLSAETIASGTAT